MWKPFERFRELDPEAQKLFGHAAALLPLIALSLRFRGFKKTKRSLQNRLSPLSTQVMSKDQVAKVVEKTCRMVRAGAHYGIGHPTCLTESLAVWYLLKRQDIPAQLRIGVRKVTEKFEAHAWVEFEGAAVNQPDEQHQHYAAFESEFSGVPGEKS
jgi:hypothetical protein